MHKRARAPACQGVLCACSQLTHLLAGLHFAAGQGGLCARRNLGLLQLQACRRKGSGADAGLRRQAAQARPKARFLLNYQPQQAPSVEPCALFMGSGLSHKTSCLPSCPLTFVRINRAHACNPKEQPECMLV